MTDQPAVSAARLPAVVVRMVACPLERCAAMPGELCKTKEGLWRSSPHETRRLEFDRWMASEAVSE